MCKREFLNYLRVREWQDFESQLRQVCKEMGIAGVTGPAADAGRRTARARRDADGIHQALLVGTAVAHRAARGAGEGDSGGPREYLGARGAKFAIFPGSGLYRKNPPVPDGRRARRDQPAVGPAERRDQAGVGRAAGPGPGQAHLLRAALVEEAGRGDGLRAGHAVRRTARRRPAGELRLDRPAARARALHPARARVRRVVRPGTGSTTRTSRCCRRPRSSSTGPGAATSSSTSTRCSTSTTPGSAPRSSAAPTSTSGGSRPGARSRSC